MSSPLLPPWFATGRFAAHCSKRAAALRTSALVG